MYRELIKLLLLLLFTAITTYPTLLHAEDVTPENITTDSSNTVMFIGMLDENGQDTMGNHISIAVVMPLKTCNIDASSSSIVLEMPPASLMMTQEPILHDAIPITDEEEVAETLITIRNMPDMNYNTDNLGDDNAKFMAIGGTSNTTDVSPDSIKLSVNEVEDAIVNLPAESRMLPLPTTTPPTAGNELPDAPDVKHTVTMNTKSKKEPNDAKTKDTPVTPNKGHKLQIEKVMYY